MKPGLLALCLLLAAVLSGCGQHANRPAGDRAYVVLVSLDGFRHDYAERYDARNILEVARGGVAARGLIPPFPSRTFPSHYTIATGLHPARHGLVANRFYDPERRERYDLSDRASVEDGSWYGGTPLWVLAETQGVRSASYFWVGTEAAVQGVRPSDYRLFDKSVPYPERIAEVGRWLRRPEAERPRLVLLYFSLVDSVGHFYGPGTPEMADAVARIDDTVGLLRSELDATGLPVNLVLLSDHGMARVDWRNPVVPSDYADLGDFVAVDEGPVQMYYHDDPRRVDAAHAALSASGAPFRTYRRDTVPEHLRFRGSPRIGDLVLVSDPPVILAGRRDKRINPATHGFDPYRHRDMHGIFYARGPAFRPGVTVDAFDSVHVYPLIAHLLGLEAPDVDGRLDVLYPTLR